VDKFCKKPEVTLFSPFSGRWSCIYHYFKSLSHLDKQNADVQLLFYDNSCDTDFGNLLKTYMQKHKNEFSHMNYIKDETPPMAGKILKEEAVARIMNEALKFISTEFMFELEDDVVAPSNAFKKLLEHLSSRPQTAFVQGVTLSRWDKLTPNAGVIREVVTHPKNLELSKAYNVSSLPMKLTGLEPIGTVGFTCYAARTSRLREVGFRTDSNGNGPDVLLGMDLNKKNWDVLIDWSVRCGHCVVSSEDMRTEVIRC